MVSTAAAFCEQAPALTESQCLRVPFFAGSSARPTGSATGCGIRIRRATTPARSPRITAFARSLRAVVTEVLGTDPGEPEHLNGYTVRVGHEGALHVEEYSPFDRAPRLST